MPPEPDHIPDGELLDGLAAAAGIAPDWHEIGGRHHQVSPDTKRALLAAMGLPAGSIGEARDSLGRLAGRDRRALPASAYAREGAAPVLRVAGDVPPRGVAIRRQDGEEMHLAVAGEETRRIDIRAADGRHHAAYEFDLPVLPVGRHEVLLDGAPEARCRLVVAPRRCFLPDDIQSGARLFGVAAHLYTLRRAQDGGIGDFTTLGAFCEGAARHGAAFVGLNPMHAQFAQYRDRASPYNPSDRRFVDPIYIDVTAPQILGEAPEVGRMLDGAGELIGALRAQPLVDYPNVWRVKEAVLGAAFAAFEMRARSQPGDADVRAFEAFVKAGGERLHRFAAFEALSEAHPGEPWFRWDASLQDPASPAVAAFVAAHGSRLRHHAYLQWLADAQFAAAAEKGRAAGLSLGLYRDIAVGMAPDGAEAWAGAGQFARGVSVGSPPDPFSADGQIWSLPPPNPVAENPGETFAHLLDANMRHAGALRIDHAMALQRLFWVPDGARGAEGAYVGYRLEDNLAELALASQAARCLVIGEDLGTVPEGFRDRIAAADILSYRVLFFERDWPRFLPPQAYPEKAVACVSTHDLPTLAGWWAGAEIAERRALGILGPEEAERQLREREGEKALLCEALQVPAPVEGNVTPLVAAAHDYIGRTPAMLAVAQIDDIVGETVAVNLPGTDRERPNWRRRLAPDVAAIFDALPQGFPRRETG